MNKLTEIESKVDKVLTSSLAGIDLTSWQAINDFVVPASKISVSEFSQQDIDFVVNKYRKLNWEIKIDQIDLETNLIFS